MPVATKRRTVHLREDSVRTAKPLKVDREQGIVFGVRVLGLDSANGRRYDPGAVRRAAHLYEGVKVLCNHARPGAWHERDVADVLGQLQNVRLAPDGGLVADLHVLLSHPFADRLMEAAERLPNCLGLSHDAEGRTELEGGVQVVREIVEVRSVDCVIHPATNRGLSEGRKRPMRYRPLRRVLEALAPRLAGKRRTRLARLLEAPGDDFDAMADTPVPEPEPDPVALDTGGADAALLAAFKAACQAVLDDDTLDMKTTLQKLKVLLRARDEVMGGASGDGEPEPDPAEMVEESRRRRTSIPEGLALGQWLMAEVRTPQGTGTPAGQLGLDAATATWLGAQPTRQRTGSVPVPTDTAALGRWLMGR